jgi:hypothetical protein
LQNSKRIRTTYEIESILVRYENKLNYLMVVN